MFVMDTLKCDGQMIIYYQFCIMYESALNCACNGEKLVVSLVLSFGVSQDIHTGSMISLFLSASQFWCFCFCMKIFLRFYLSG
jgi:hypothetical protein